VLRRRSSHEETLAALEHAETLARGSTPAEAALASLGQGWVAEEALAIALFCALRAENLEEGLIMAVNITGDSDSTGAITGNLLGVSLGIHEIPERWLAPLELRDVITEMADDLATVDEWALSVSAKDTTERGWEQEYWCGRYPSW
jgi:ADP-ribosylglycohydrolase